MLFKHVTFYINIAHRNLWRRKSRTLLLGAAFSFLTLMLVLLWGYSNGISTQMHNQIIENMTGDTVVASNESEMNALGYEKIYSYNSKKAINCLSLLGPLEFRRQYRVISFLYSQNLQRDALLVGMEPNGMRRLRVIKGEYLNSMDKTNKEIMIPRYISEDLTIDIGDEVAVEVVTPQGMRNFNYFKVKGMYQIPGTAEIMIGHIAIISLYNAQQLMNEDEDKVTEIILSKSGKGMTSEFMKSAQEMLAPKKLTLIDHKKYGDMIFSIVDSFVIIVWIVGIIAMMIIIVFFFDTMLANVEERKKEYGIMMSMGLSLLQISSLVLGEFALFSLYFVLPAVILGGITVKILGNIGIRVPETVKVFMGGMERLAPHVNNTSLSLIFIGIFVIIEIVNLYSLIKINHLDPVEVLKSV